MRANRRVFLASAASLGWTTLLQGRQARRCVSLAGKALIDRMHWFNHPASYTVVGRELIVTSRSGSDFWRKTLYAYSADSGHFLYVQVSGDFVLESRVSGRYKSRYDQAGLMVRLDCENWLKCGLVLVDGVGNGTTVVRRDFSDWSAVRGIDQTVPIWWRIVRKTTARKVLYSHDGEHYTSTRVAYLPLPRSLDAGIMCASPEGDGFESRFDHLSLKAYEEQGIRE